MLNDLRYGFRQLLQSPGFTAVAVITLALGIGANTAIFSVVDAVLLKQLPYRDPDHLVMIWEKPPTGAERNFVTPATFLDWTEQSLGFEQMGAMAVEEFYLSRADEPAAWISGGRVSANFFTVLGLKTVLGRSFLPEEARPGADRVVLLGHDLWQSRFGGDPNLIGKSILLNGAQFTVVGVLQRHTGLERGWAQLWTPLAFDAS